MKYCKKNIGSSDEIRSFIGECEADFETRLDAAVAQACADRTLKVITLSGPTCSGKTTAAKKLSERRYISSRSTISTVISRGSRRRTASPILILLMR